MGERQMLAVQTTRILRRSESIAEPYPRRIPGLDEESVNPSNDRRVPDGLIRGG